MKKLHKIYKKILIPKIVGSGGQGGIQVQKHKKSNKINSTLGLLLFTKYTDDLNWVWKSR